jgi:hypothetical protein
MIVSINFSLSAIVNTRLHFIGCNSIPQIQVLSPTAETAAEAGLSKFATWSLDFALPGKVVRRRLRTQLAYRPLSYAPS